MSSTTDFLQDFWQAGSIPRISSLEHNTLSLRHLRNIQVLDHENPDK